TPAVLDRQLPLRDPETISDRVGPWPERALVLAGIVALAVAAAMGRRPQSPNRSLDLDSSVSIWARV
ncbi:MAG TPA: hypothetical protein VFA96_09545, partial [Nocardioides sp.]|nr:hypothetical protein [Nocardioides sp.]